MLYPDFKTYKKLSHRGNLIPIVKELILDRETPVSAFIKVSCNETSAFLLESVEYGEKIGRYSFIGFDPEIILEKNDDNIVVKERARGNKSFNRDDLLDVMKDILSRYKLVPVKNLPAFCGGFVGFLSYENVAIFEDVYLKKMRSLNFPNAIFFLVRSLIVFDHLDKKVKLIVMSHANKSIKHSYDEALKKIGKLEKSFLRKKRTFVKSKQKKYVSKIKSNMTKKQFVSSVNKIKKYIRAGDVIQVVFSQRFFLGKTNNDFNIYRALRTINPSPYMFYFKHNDIRLIGSSPEMLVRKEGEHAEVRPIAGTRKRGKNADEDKVLARELKSDEKELAEHLMLVDLGRNDIGRVCQFNTIKVKDYARIEKYSHVMHLVSEVHGLLRKGKDSFDLLRATFPAGTVTGAPKIRAMEIINEIEPTERGPYAGCVGYFGFNENCDMCITIRTIMMKGKKVFLQVGAGIVFDSVPSREYIETLNKAKALIKAVEIAESEIL